MSHPEIKIDPDCKQRFDEFKSGLYKYIAFRIRSEDQTIEADMMAEKRTTETEADEKASWNELTIQLLDVNQTRFCVYQFNFKNDAGKQMNRSAYLWWCPGNTSGGDKMVQSRVNELMKRMCTPMDKYFQCGDEDDLSFDDMIVGM